MKEFFEKSALQNHPLRALQSFLEQEKANELAKKYDDLRFVGYVLDIGYDTVTIITSDPYKIAVGGVPRNSMLIMVPSNYDKLPHLRQLLLRYQKRSNRHILNCKRNLCPNWISLPRVNSNGAH